MLVPTGEPTDGDIYGEYHFRAATLRGQQRCWWPLPTAVLLSSCPEEQMSGQNGNEDVQCYLFFCRHHLERTIAGSGIL